MPAKKHKRAVTNDRLRLTIPLEQIEGGAREQIERTLALPCLKVLAIMPDVHVGYDLPIGGVALLDGHIWPGAVGYDIGCGMCHVLTEKPLAELPDLHQVYNRILQLIPVGFETHKKKTGFDKFPNVSGDGKLNDVVREKAPIQLGTLGGGNHFIEIGVNPYDIVGITIHSGSRHPGWQIGDYYMKKTKGPVPVDSAIARAYVQDMEWALEYALENRAAMMRRCLEALGLGEDLMQGMINENHNHAEITPAGVLHRKGATPAESGQLGIIPANMRDGVWITRGLGNEFFLCSASHGAGRTMSRKKARQAIDFRSFMAQMEGIVAPVEPRLLDEAPDAYKKIDDVLKAQDGVLVDVIDHFRPVLVVKGCSEMVIT
ncbi:MAG: RtcB family protein [Proteobacteria bacterium]|nr:RtcB family protein [Pseudomonadota bacterium]